MSTGRSLTTLELAVKTVKDRLDGLDKLLFNYYGSFDKYMCLTNLDDQFEWFMKSVNELLQAFNTAKDEDNIRFKALLEKESLERVKNEKLLDQFPELADVKLFTDQINELYDRKQLIIKTFFDNKENMEKFRLAKEKLNS